MKLYNCMTPIEETLKNIELEHLEVGELRELTDTIHKGFTDGELENEIIVVDALVQVSSELASRIKF